MSLRKQKTERRRDEMLAAAQRLFRERGYAETTVEAIAGAAGLSPRTFYRYFGSKDGVLAAMGADVVVATAEQLPKDASIEEMVQRLVSELAVGAGGEPAALVSRLIRTEPQLSDRVATWHKVWSEQLAHELARRDNRSEPSIRERVNSTVAIQVTGLILDEWLLRRLGHDLEALTAEIIDVLCHDIAR